MLYAIVGDTKVYVTWCLSSRRLRYLTFRDRILSHETEDNTSIKIYALGKYRKMEQTN